MFIHSLLLRPIFIDILIQQLVEFINALIYQLNLMNSIPV